jgi:nitrate/nitrite-specific signal transduction histidine kinase
MKSLSKRTALKIPSGPRSGTLQTRLTLQVLLPILLLLIAVAGLIVISIQQVTADLVSDRNLEKTRLLADQLDTTLGEYQQALQLIAGQEEILSGTASRQQQNLTELWTNSQLFRFDHSMIILDKQGKVTAWVPETLELTSNDLSSLAVLTSARSNRQPTWSDVLTTLVPDSKVIVLAALLDNPLGEEQGAILGVIRVERQAARVSSFFQSIWDLYIGRDSTAYLVDGSGKIIFHTDTFLIGEDFSNQAHIERLQAGQAGVVRTQNIDNRRVVSSYTPVPGTDWGLVTEELWEEVMRPSRPYILFLWGLLALIIIIPAAIVYRGTRQITRPLERLTRAAEQIADGNLSQEIQLNTGDELEKLGRQFNKMSAALAVSYAELEHELTARTKELSALNRISAEVSSSWDLESVLKTALQESLQLMGLTQGAAFLFSEEDSLHLLAQQGFSPVFTSAVQLLPLNDSLASRALEEGQPAIRNIAAYPEGVLKTKLIGEGAAAVISVPLMMRGRTLGAINLVSPAQRKLSRAELDLLAAVGQQAGVAVEIARLHHQMEQNAAAAERTRLARDLHDAVSQTLFSASLIAEALPRLWTKDRKAAEEKLILLQQLTRGALAEMRSLLLELRPSVLAKSDLDDLLVQLVQAAAGRSILQPNLSLEEIHPLPEREKIVLYRIAQEAVNNVIKHAQADQLNIRLKPRGKAGVKLTVEDNGRGFDPEQIRADRFGMDNMRERAAQIGAVLSWESTPGQGTRLNVIWQAQEVENDC